MPDGPRRSARIAELTKKRRTSEAKTTESHPNLGSHATKEKISSVNPSRLRRDQPPKRPAIKGSKTREIETLERRKGKRRDVEHEPLNQKRRGRHPVAGKTAPQQARASKRLPAKHLVRQSDRNTALTSDSLGQLRVEAAPQQDSARAALSRDALHRLETQTAQHPLPEDLSTYRRTPDVRDMPATRETATNKTAESASRTTAYNKEFADVLEEMGVLEQQFLTGKAKLQAPKNHREILSAIKDKRAQSPEPSPLDYKEYTEAVFDSRSEDAVLMDLFPLYFGIPLRLEDGHRKENDPVWTNGVAITGSSSPTKALQKTKPDYTEGLRVREIPAWVRKEIGPSAVPSGITAFPNFLVELKRDMSMYTAHLQNRHRGAIASQAYHEYYEKIRERPEKSWGWAKVGSIEFNGDTIVGNVHWVDKNSDGSERKYHMTRVLCMFTYGLKFGDFKEARRKARNFRDYFAGIRDDLREECKALHSAPAARPQASPDVPARSQVRTRSNPLPSVVEEDGQEPEGSSTERPSSRSTEPEEDLTPEPSTRITRKRGKRAQGNTQKDTSGRKPKKRKNDNAEQVSGQNATGLSFVAKQLTV